MNYTSIKILCKECKKKMRKANAEYMRKYRAKIRNEILALRKAARFGTNKQNPK
jgi:hypothetical protein